MRCPYCKEENPPGNLKCSYCGESLRQSPMPGERTNYIPDYLAQSILVTLFCCLPFGIVAIVYAARVKAFLLGGQYAMAREASNKAKMWCWVSFLIVVGLGAVYMFLIFIAAVIESL